jgi:hypothetical protein
MENDTFGVSVDDRRFLPDAPPDQEARLSATANARSPLVLEKDRTLHGKLGLRIPGISGEIEVDIHIRTRKPISADAQKETEKWAK